ncbi:MAG: polysaccharide lyase [Flavisolibacter sp.]|nr:polysaccharide lyase [Flavisolibacter sp.]
MLLQGLLFATLFSCQKEGLETQHSPESFEEVPTATGTISAAATANIIYEENFEGSNPFGTYVSKQFATSYGFTTVSTPLFDGKKVGRFELRDTDPLSHSGTRAEVSFPTPSVSDLHRWYSFAEYFPSAQWKTDDADEVLAQWHQGGGYSPSISLRGKNDHLWLYVKPTPSTTEKIDLGAIPKDKWNQFVFHIKHSSGSDGIIELYINGNRVYNRTGVSMYDLAKYGATAPKLKLGIYKSDWNSKTTKSNIRVVYVDNVRLGNSKATYAEMAAKGSGTATTPPPTSTTPPPTTTTPPPTSTTPTISPITSFTLVSAHTEKDVMTISNGASISLATIKKLTGAHKLNIRANTNSSTVKSVKFELSGAQSRVYTDKEAHFALYDNSGSNYYYGDWNPPATGSYTLKATPYTTADASGTAGVSNSIIFSFVN